MKKLMWLLCFLPSVAMAVDRGIDMPFNAATDGCVDITSHTWTAVPTTALAGRSWLDVTNPSTITVFGAADNTLAVSTAVAPRIITGGSSIRIEASDQVPFYFHRVGPSGEKKLCTEEVKHP